jgi:hypothetical protein
MAKKALLTKKDKERLVKELGLSSVEDLHQFNAEVIELLNPLSIRRQKLDAMNRILERLKPSDI